MTSSYGTYRQSLIDRLASLSPQAKMEDCGKAIVYQAPYDTVRRFREGSHPVFVLDLINYSRELVPDPLPMSTVLETFEIEPGYGSLSGDVELGRAVRQLEAARARHSASHYGHSLASDSIDNFLEQMIVYTGTGVTGAFYLTLRAILERDTRLNRRRKKIVYNAPTFNLADGFTDLYGLVAEPVHGSPDELFRPSLDNIRDACTQDTLACVVVLPTNPSQVSWGADDIDALARLIQHCQEHEIFLIADTIFQDLAWDNRPIPEVFALADKPDFLCKVFSPSKDRPFACGYRIGYVIADPQLLPGLDHSTGLVYNSNPTQTQVWMGLDSVMRVGRLHGELREEDWEPLDGSYLFGYAMKNLSAKELHHRVQDSSIYDTYVSRLSRFQEIVDGEMQTLWTWLDESECFSVLPRPPFGNILIVKVQDGYCGDENTLFLDMLEHIGITAMVGGCFGIRPSEGTWFRVIYGGNPLKDTIEGLEALQELLKRGAR